TRRGMSVWKSGWFLLRSILRNSRSVSRSRQGRSLWPSMRTASFWICRASSVSLTGSRPFFGGGLSSAADAAKAHAITARADSDRATTAGLRNIGKGPRREGLVLLWGQVGNLPGLLGKLPTCPHIFPARSHLLTMTQSLTV